MSRLYNLPKGSVVTYEYTEDGDRRPSSVMYPTEDGKSNTVKFVTTIDGDTVPDVGFNIDGDRVFPGALLDW